MHTSATIGPALKYFWVKLFASIPLGYVILTETHWNIIYGISFMILLDTFLGVWLSIKKRNFSSWRLGRLAGKISKYAIALATVHILSVSSPILFGWTFHYFGVFLILTEALSNFEKLALLGWKSPQFLLAKLNSQFKDLYEGNKEVVDEIIKKK